MKKNPRRIVKSVSPLLGQLSDHLSFELNFIMIVKKSVDTDCQIFVTVLRVREGRRSRFSGLS